MDAICEHISQTTGNAFQHTTQRSVGGGCINSAYVLSDSNRQFFVKTNIAERLDMFEAEYEGLSVIANSNSIKVPNPICFGLDGSVAYLVMEYISAASGRSGSVSIETFGRNLAAMHQVTQSQYGWFRDNTIGSTPQINHPDDNWLRFWREKRLGFQLQLAANSGYAGRMTERGQKLLEKLEGFFSKGQPQAALLHGDLWSGNYFFDKNHTPVIFDPAVYFGDREADIAMTELFGGFPSAFYDAYNEAFPLDAAYKTRKTLYNLYHILNHVNLFGAGYVGQAEHMIDRLLSEVQ